MTNHSSLLITLAGIAVFMYGMTLASENLQKLAANKIRDLIAKLSDKPFLGVLVGIILTVLIQSSGAVTSMLVGLGTAGVVTLPQVMGVIIGTAIGTTVTVQLLSLNVAQYGLGIFTFGFLIFFLSSKRGVRRTMKVVMGFGMLFWGLELIGVGTEALKSADLFMDSISFLRANPLVAILCTAFFTAVVHSSAATVGFAMSLAATGTITLYDAIFWVYGANIGTTATALMASAGGNYIGRQVAWAHCFFKVIGVVVFFYFTDVFAQFIITENIQRDVANAHTLFNLFLAILFYPFINVGARLIQRIMPRPASERPFSTKFLDRGDFESTSIALAHAEREVLRMGDIVSWMVKECLNLFRDQDKDLYLTMRARDDKVDLLNREISLYLTQVMDSSDSSDQSQMIRLLSYATDLESAADVIDKGMIDLAAKKHNLKLEFSKEGWQELEDVHKRVVKAVEMSLTCFQRRDLKLAEQIVVLKRDIKTLEKKYRASHIDRLVAGRKESINTSSIHIDLLGDFRRVVGLVSNHVYALINEGEKYGVYSKSESRD